MKSTLRLPAIWTICGLVCLLLSFRAYPVDCVSSPAGLVAWWRGEGDADDFMGRHNGILRNETTFLTGMVGSAFRVDGGSYVEVPNSNDLNFGPGSAMTAELWAYRTASGAVGHFLGKRVSGTAVYGYQMAWDPIWGLNFGTTVAGVRGGVNTGLQLPMQTWTHLAATVEGGTYRFYINGQLVATATNQPFGETNAAALTIGNSGSFEPFSGLLDEVAIYSRALASNEIAAIYAAGSAGKCAACLPHGATATADVVNGFVVGAMITDRGCGYTSPPSVLIVGGSGAGATATAVLSNGSVVGITITSAGFGYTTAPTILIGSPPFMPWLETGVSRIKVTQHVVLGRSYVLESSLDLVTWAQVGDKFTAQSEVITQEFEVDVTGRFFRIKQVP